MTRAVLAIAVLAFAPSVAAADTISVCLDGSCDFDDIQEAINAASDGDLITVAAGTYLEDGIDFQGKEITLRGEQGSGGEPAVTIDAQRNGGVLNCSKGETNNTIIENIIVTGGFTDIGAGLMVFHSRPTLINCMFIDNESTGLGGGVYNLNGAPAFYDCRFIGNTASNGGAMMTFESGQPDHPRYERCSFEGNNAEFGGAIYNFRSSPTFSDCAFTENSADFGGGIENYQSDPVLSGCTFQGNQATSTGGGMDNWESSPTLEDCVISNNDAAIGGGIYNTSSSSNTSLQDSTVCGNSPDQIFGIWHDEGGNSVTEECALDCPADFNGDGEVNGGDLGVLLAEWGACTDCAADLNGDGFVDGGDLGVFLAAWGSCP
jgi:hypothetical protein